MDKYFLAEKFMPAFAERALANFIQVNPNWKGASWADCLQPLDDSDSNLEVTEPEYDWQVHQLGVNSGAIKFVNVVSLTLYWAFPTIPLDHERVSRWCEHLANEVD
jgi:hypothetical protein